MSMEQIGTPTQLTVVMPLAGPRPKIQGSTRRFHNTFPSPLQHTDTDTIHSFATLHWRHLQWYRLPSIYRWPCFAEPLVVVQTLMSYVSTTHGVSCGLLWDCRWWLTRSDLFRTWEVHPGQSQASAASNYTFLYVPPFVLIYPVLLFFLILCIEHALAPLSLPQCPASMSHALEPSLANPGLIHTVWESLSLHHSIWSVNPQSTSRGSTGSLSSAGETWLPCEEGAEEWVIL